MFRQSFKPRQGRHGGKDSREPDLLGMRGDNKSRCRARATSHPGAMTSEAHLTSGDAHAVVSNPGSYLKVLANKG